jgi:hypothetical protein
MPKVSKTGGNKWGVEGFSAEKILQMMVLFMEELFTDVGCREARTNRRNVPRATLVGQRGQCGVPIGVTLQYSEMGVLPMGSKFSIEGVSAPCSTIRRIDASTVPAMCYHIKGFLGPLGGTIDKPGRTQKEGMNNLD